MTTGPTPIARIGLFDGSRGIAADRLLAGVTASEQERYRSLARRPKRAQQYLASRWLLRAHLAPELGLKPIDLPLRNNAHGPPTLAGIPCYLGLSHSGALCLCFTSTQARVGCDVERHRPRRRLHAIATQFFHPDEAASLSAVEDDDAHADFYRLWTLKEAGRKALGQGLGGGLRAPAFMLRPTLRCLLPLDRTPWTFAVCTLMRPSGRYSLALAIGAPQGLRSLAVDHYSPGPHGPETHRLRIAWNIAMANRPPDSRGPNT